MYRIRSGLVMRLCENKTGKFEKDGQVLIN